MPASSSSSDKKKKNKNKTVAPQMMVMQPGMQPMQPMQQMQPMQMQQMQPMQMQQMQPMQMQPMQVQQPIAVMQPTPVEKKKKKKKGSKSSSSSSDKNKQSEIAKEAKSYCKTGAKALACYIGGPVILCFIIIIVIAIAAGGSSISLDECPLGGSKACTDDQGELNGPNGQGSCWNDCDCDGARDCSAWGWCQGTQYTDECPLVVDEPEPVVEDECPLGGSKACTVDQGEINGPNGPASCADDCDCDGARFCSTWGWCQGTQYTDECPLVVTCDPLCTTDQPENGPNGQHSCYTGDDCSCGAARYCSAFGWCTGAAYNDYCIEPLSATDILLAEKAEVCNIVDSCDIKECYYYDCLSDCDCTGARTCDVGTGFCFDEHLCDPLQVEESCEDINISDIDFSDFGDDFDFSDFDFDQFDQP